MLQSSAATSAHFSVCAESRNFPGWSRQYGDIRNRCDLFIFCLNHLCVLLEQAGSGIAFEGFEIADIALYREI